MVQSKNNEDVPEDANIEPDVPARFITVFISESEDGMASFQIERSPSVSMFEVPTVLSLAAQIAKQQMGVV